jgi:hypothetical protein
LGKTKQNHRLINRENADAASEKKKKKKKEK